MIKTIYHGSDHIIQRPVFHGGKRNNDYGYGFYCTESKEMAMEWAVRPESDGFANSYQIDLSGLRILKLSADYPVIVWLAVLLKNRRFNLDTPLSREAYSYISDHFSIDLEPYDIITGYRADDSYFSFAQDFLSNAISYEQLCAAMQLGNLGEQFVLQSRRSHERVAFVEAIPALRESWLEKKLRRDRAARAAYLQSDRMSYRRGELYVMEILDREMKEDDPRLR